MNIHATPKSKKLLLVLGAIFTVAVIIATTVFSTVAYLTHFASVTNTFTIGKIGMKLDEAAVGSDGKRIDGADRVTSNKYHLVPNKTYDKDPVITIDSTSESSYLFIIVYNDIVGIECEETAHTGSHANTSMTASGSSGDSHNACIKHQLAANGWKEIEQRKDASGRIGTVYVYIGKSGDTGYTGNALPIKGNQVDLNANRFILFRTFTIKANANVSDYANAKIDINAFAIQSESVGTPADAWAALCTTYPDAVGTVAP